MQNHRQNYSFVYSNFYVLDNRRENKSPYSEISINKKNFSSARLATQGVMLQTTFVNDHQAQLYIQLHTVNCLLFCTIYNNFLWMLLGITVCPLAQRAEEERIYEFSCLSVCVFVCPSI
jgi:hypothetical protein